MFGLKKRKAEKRVVSLLLAVLLGVSAMLPQTVLAESGDTGVTVISGKLAEKKSYQKGKILLSMTDHDSEKVVMDVLYREEDGMVWVNGEAFEAYFPEYEYTYTPYSDEEDSQGYVQIRAYSRHYAFRTGSATSVYKTWEVENFYTLQEKVIAYDGKAWIPAEDFFYYLCCSTAAVHGSDGLASSSGNLAEDISAAAAEQQEDTGTQDATEWVPLQDFLMVSDPQYTLIDILYDIYSNDFGLYWMFDYERDFGVTEEQMDKVLAAADLALSFHAVATMDLETMAATLEQPFVAIKNEFSKIRAAIFGEEEAELSSGFIQDNAYAELFINAMANSTAEMAEFVNDSAEKRQSVLEDLLSSAGLTVTNVTQDTQDVSEEALEKTVNEIIALLETDSQNMQNLLKQTENGQLMRGIFSKEVNDLSKSTSELLTTLQTLKTVAKFASAALKPIVSAISVTQELQNMDEMMIDAMEKYVQFGKWDTELDESLYNAFSLQINQWGKGEGYYFITESFTKTIGSFLEDAVKGIATPLGLAATISDLTWSLFENSELYPDELASSDEPKSLKISLYGRLYEYDAWQILTEYYQEYVYANNFCNQDQIEDCAYLALNYLKSCYVTTEAALDALVGSEIKEDLTYQKVEKKCTKLVEMMIALEEDLSCLDTGRELEEESLQTIALGVPFQQRIGGNEFSEDLFLHDENRESGRSYSYFSPLLDADEMLIAPLVACVDYYAFLRNELLPARGLSSQETTSHVIENEISSPWNTEGGWDSRSGLMGADVVDLNGDGSDDFLVYFMEENTEYSSTENDARPENLIAELYTVTAEGKIERITSLTLAGDGYDLTYDRINIGLMEKDGRVFLYEEYDGFAYYANGGSITYAWYGWDGDGELRLWWMLGDPYGGSTCLTCTLMVYDEYGNYSEYIINADGEFRYFYPEVEIYEDEWSYSTEESIRVAFSMLDLPEAGIYTSSENGYYADDGQVPTYWGTEWLKESVSYLCTGENSEEIYGEDGSYQGIRRTMQVSWEDRSGLREKLDEIGYETQVGDYWSDGSVVALVDEAGQAYNADGTALTPIS